MADDLGERTEAPTGRRLFEARQKGQVAKSPDLGAGIDLVGAFVLLLVFGAPVTAALAGMLRFLLDSRESGQVLRDPGGAIADLCKWAAAHTGIIIAPFLLIMFVIAALAQFLQVGWLLTGEPIMPKLTKINPLAGVQRLFGLRNLVKTGLGLIKMTVITVVAVYLVISEWEKVAALATLDVRAIWLAVIEILTRVLIWLLAILFIIGVVDYAYQRWQHTRDLKMTKQQVKEEQRSMDGDPEIKGRRMRMAREIALQRVKSAVPKADVIVTNPTHFAVALQYDPKTMTAPKVVAKGADFLAFRIREIAAAHKIPIVERPPLARALYASAPVGKQISPEYYEAVAEILAYVYRLENRESAA